MRRGVIDEYSRGLTTWRAGPWSEFHRFPPGTGHGQAQAWLLERDYDLGDPSPVGIDQSIAGPYPGLPEEAGRMSSYRALTSVAGASDADHGGSTRLLRHGSRRIPRVRAPDAAHQTRGDPSRAMTCQARLPRRARAGARRTRAVRGPAEGVGMTGTASFDRERLPCSPPSSRNRYGRRSPIVSSDTTSSAQARVGAALYGCDTLGVRVSGRTVTTLQSR